jgi:peroxiredoxin
MQRHESYFRIAAGLLIGMSLLAGCSQSKSTVEKSGDKQSTETAPREKAVAEPGQDSSPATESVAPAQEPTPQSAEAAAPKRPAIEVAASETAEAPALQIPTEPEPAPQLKAQASQTPAPLPASKAPLPLDNVPTAELKMPSVVLSDQHAALCKVKVGDPFPALELPDISGARKTLNELYGSKLTLVVFWNGKQPTAIEELSDLTRYFLPRFADKGLAVVAIDSGDEATKAGELSQKAGAAYPVLSDADGAALTQVATSKLPRSYLLDPSGKIIWFDLEYSPTTRRDLAQAIRFTLER